MPPDKENEKGKTGTSSKIENKPTPPAPGVSPTPTPPGNDGVTQNNAPVVEKKPVEKPADKTVFVGNLTNGNAPVVTPDDPNYTYKPSQPASPRLNAATQAVLDNKAASDRRTALWRQHDAEAKARSDKAWNTFKTNAADYRKANEARRQGWKEGKFDGMKSIDADTWEALGKRDGGYTTNQATDDKGNLIVVGKNADGTPIFQETYRPNGGSKFDAAKNAEAINQLNNWWMKEGGFQSSRGKIPTGVFGKDGKIDPSKIQTQDQFRAIQQVMKAQVSAGLARRDQAYRNLNESRAKDATPRGRDADMQYLLNKGVRVQFDPNTGVRTGISVPGADGKPVTHKWSDQQVAAIAQEYRRNDALGALQGFEESQKNVEDGKQNGDARTYFEDNGDFENRDAARIKENLIAAGRAAGLRSDQMADESGNIDPERIRAALGGEPAPAPATPKKPTGQAPREQEPGIVEPDNGEPDNGEPVNGEPDISDIERGFEDQQFEDIMRGADEMINAPMNRTEPLTPEAPPVPEVPPVDDRDPLAKLLGGPGIDLKGPSIFDTGNRFSEDGSILDYAISEIGDTIPFVDKIPAVKRAQERNFNRTVDAYARLNPNVSRENIAAQLQHNKAMANMFLSAAGMTRMPMKGMPAVPRTTSTTAVVPRTAPGRVPARAQLPAPRAELPAPDVAQLPAPRAQLTAPERPMPVAVRSPRSGAVASGAQRAEAAGAGELVNLEPMVIEGAGRRGASPRARPRLSSRRRAELGYDGAIDAEFTAGPATRTPGEAKVARTIINSGAGKRAKPKRRHN